jgi:hypothetical protein
MSTYTSISDLLHNSGAQFRIFDMGRRISKLNTSQFEKLEQGLIPYPTPYLHHAWLALMLWNPKEKAQNVVWFLKFPLDEQGFLVQAVRDDFLNRLLQNMSQMVQGDELDSDKDALKNNPFSFTPDQEKMAMFHAIAADITNMPNSQFYQGAVEYYSGQKGWEQWSELGYQGIADLVTKASNNDQTQTLLAKAIPHLPAEPLSALCTCLEHIEPSFTLATALKARIEVEIGTSTASNIVAALLRGLSNTHSEEIKKSTLLAVLNSEIANKAEVLAAIATRCHQVLQHTEVLSLYLEKLATSEAGQTGFSRILADLMFMPVMRALILQSFRNPNRSDALSSAIGKMFGNSFDTPAH